MTATASSTRVQAAPVDGRLQKALDGTRDLDLTRAALGAFLGVLGRAPELDDLDALNAALKAYQSAEDSRRETVLAAQDPARDARERAAAREAVALDAAVKLVAHVVTSFDIVDVGAYAKDLERLAEATIGVAAIFSERLEAKDR